MTQLIKSLNQYSTTVLESSNLLDDNNKTVQSVDIIDIVSNLSIPTTNSGKKHNNTSLHKRPLHEATAVAVSVVAGGRGGGGGGVTTPQVKESKMKSSAPEQQQQQKQEEQEEGGHHPMMVVRDSGAVPRVNKITPKMNPNKNWKENYQQQATQRN